MVNVIYEDTFKHVFKKIKNKEVIIQIKKQIEKIVNNPEIGKPMRYSRKNSREMYIKPYRLAYKYYKEDNTILFINIYHKDEQ